MLSSQWQQLSTTATAHRYHQLSSFPSHRTRFAAGRTSEQIPRVTALSTLHSKTQHMGQCWHQISHHPPEG